MGVDIQSSWITEILLNKLKVSFKLDTGAEVTATSDNTYRWLGLPELQKLSKVLYSPAKWTLNFVEQFTTTLEHERNTSQQVVFVIKGLRNNLLDLPANVHADGIWKQLPKVFTGKH